MVLAALIVLIVAWAEENESLRTRRYFPTSVVASSNQSGNPDQVKYKEPMQVPDAFKSIDFSNLVYPTSLRGRIRLRGGRAEFENANGLGGDTFELASINFVDLTSDQVKEAVVRIRQASCGASCDGGSDLFYFYSIKAGRLSERWRFETGSRAYDCGLKGLTINANRITLETFRACRMRNRQVVESRERPDDGLGGKFAASSFTRFEFEFSGNRLRSRSRAVFPYEKDDLMNFRSLVRVSQ